MKFSGFCSIFLLLVLFSCYDEINSLDSPCGTWASFKDEKCFGILDDTLRTFADAEKECAKLENSPTLALIHSAEEQEFLSNFLFSTSKKVENFWLGAKVVNSKVAWTDNSELGYTNWDTKSLAPRNKPNYCVQMEADEVAVGKWIDEPCEKKNLVVCQRMQTWSIARLQKTLLDSRKESRDALDEANKKISKLEQMLENEKASSSKSIADLKQNLIPIEFIYTQLPNQKAPSEIWPSMTWSDVSATYAGLFFRVEGGGSQPFGQTQTENAPRLYQIENYGGHNFGDNPSNHSVYADSSSKWVWTGDRATNTDYPMFLRFSISGGEVRPRNEAIRLWKRIK